jgi:hypothetical protein
MHPASKELNPLVFLMFSLSPHSLQPIFLFDLELSLIIFQ